MSQYNFFISYCSEDGRGIANNLYFEFKKRGYSVFMDLESINEGFVGDFSNVIANAISGCDCFIPIITDGAFSNRSIESEIEFAVKRAKRVIPIVGTDKIDNVIHFYIGRLQKFRINKNLPLGLALEKIVDELDAILGNMLKGSLLYEKLAEYKKLNNSNKEAETICELISMLKIRNNQSSYSASQRKTKFYYELLKLYEQLSHYVGGRDDESCKVAKRILRELDDTEEMLKGDEFLSGFIDASVAIRLIYLDKDIREECLCVLRNMDVIQVFTIEEYAKKQQPFVDVFYDEYKNIEKYVYEKKFIEETKKYIFDPNASRKSEIDFEREVQSALAKCGYIVDTEARVGDFRFDIAIKQKGKYVLFIECVSRKTKKKEEQLKLLEEHVKSMGGALHVIYRSEWAKDSQAEIEKIKSLIPSVSSEDDELLLSVAKFVREGNKVFDLLQKKGIAGDFLECLRESYERLKSYCVIVGADDVAAECAGRIVELRNEIGKETKDGEENEKAEKGIKSLLGFTLEGSGTYDVFISFKNEDSDLAQKIYDYCHKHTKVPFWSKKTLPRLSKSEYSKAIDDALENSKHFVVVLSDLEYLNAEWISYEMDAFNNEIKEGRKKDSNFVIVATDDVYNQIIGSNKKVLNIAYRRYQIIKMSDYEETLAQYIS